MEFLIERISNFSYRLPGLTGQVTSLKIMRDGEEKHFLDD